MCLEEMFCVSLQCLCLSAFTVLTCICLLCFFYFSVCQLKRSFPFMAFQMLPRSPARTSLSSVQQSYSNWTFIPVMSSPNTIQNQVFPKVCWKLVLPFVWKVYGVVLNDINMLPFLFLLIYIESPGKVCIFWKYVE